MSMFIHRGRPRIAQPIAVTMLARRAAYHMLLCDSTEEAAISAPLSECKEASSARPVNE